MMPKGDHKTTYKKEPWNHLSPTRILLRTSLRSLRKYLDRRLQERIDKMVNKSAVRLTVGISDYWTTEERKAGNVSTSGAKLYVQIERPHGGHTWLRDAALARVAALLQEETLQACDGLCVERKGHLEGWGMAKTPDLVKQQKSRI